MYLNMGEVGRFAFALLKPRTLTGLVEGPTAPPLLDVDDGVDDGHEGEGGGRRSKDEGERPQVLVDGDGAVIERSSAQGEAKEARDDRPGREPLEAVAVPAVGEHDHAGLYSNVMGELNHLVTLVE